MAEDAELIGGISVSVGASHTKLISDLAEADRILEQWAKTPRNATIGANVGVPAGGAGGGGGGGSTSALEAKLDRLTAAMGRGSAQDIRKQRAEAEAVTIGGVKIGALSQQGTALQNAIAKQLGDVEVPVHVETDKIEGATTQIRDLQVTSEKPITLNFDTKTLQNELQAVLATWKEIAVVAAEAAKAGAASVPRAAGGGRPPRARTAVQADGEDPEIEGGAPKGPRRKNIRDRGLGTEADTGRIYTYGGARPAGSVAPESGSIQQASYYGGEDDEYTHQQALQEAAQARQREMATSRRNQQAQAAQAASDRRAMANAQRADEQTRRQDAEAQAQNAAQSHRARLEQLTQEAAADRAGFQPAGRTPNPGTPEQQRDRIRPTVDIAARDRQRAEEAARLAREPRAEPYRLPSERPGARGAGAGVGYAGAASRVSDEEVERQRATRVAVSQAQSVSAGRTARTAVSSLASYIVGGKERQQAEAELAAATARRKRDARDVAEAEKFSQRPEVVANIRNRTDALADLNSAQDKLKKSLTEEAAAREKVSSFSSFGAGARNIVAITAAGAAFGIGLQAISTAAKAAEKALAPYVDVASGYAQKTADFTGALADQARAMQGNAKGVTELKLAQSGFSQANAAAVQPIVEQRVQIEAGNKALVEQVETFRIAENLRKSGANTGIGGSGTGGVFGTSLFGIPSTGEQAGNFLQGLGKPVAAVQSRIDNPAPFQSSAQGIEDFLSNLTGLPGAKGLSDGSADQKALAEAQASFGRGLDFVNSQLQKGGISAAKFQQALSGTDARVEATAAAFDQLSPEMATAIRDNHLYADAIAGSSDALGSAISALKSINAAGTLTGSQEQVAGGRIARQNARNSIDALREQQAYDRPAFISNVGRQQGIADQQLEAQQALANLANPPAPVGTGRVAANAAEQKQIKKETFETQQIQDELNMGYEVGRKILVDTYKPMLAQNFGQAAAQSFDMIIGQITATGAEMAKISAGISNEQAAYQTAQYNYQLHIAKRTLSDIGGLTGQNFGAGKSYLGVLEGQNLALSRQAQLLQFGLAQRQINFQRAVAGFVVPGLTPAEQNARVNEAKIEADFAQKQLNIQKQMFGNQVKIVDIGNLRQGADLVRQIGLLQQGRQVTIDTQAAQEKLERLNKRQQQLVARVGTFITAVDQVVAKASSDMAAQEQVLGKTLTRFETQAVAVMYHVGEAFMAGLTGGIANLSGGQQYTGQSTAGQNDARHNASGYVGTAKSATMTGVGVMGEAGDEAYAILRNPRAIMGLGGSGGGATVNFNGDMHFKTEADFQRLYRMVLTALGRDAATKGLRTPF